MGKAQKKKDLELLENDNIAKIEYKEHKKNKSLSKHDLKVIKPLTDAQEEMMKSYMSGSSILATGSSGTGKTFIALYLALNDMLDKNMPQNKINIIRSVVATREIGFLPGDLEEKMEVYETPYVDIFSELFNGKPTCYNNFKKQQKVNFMSTSFLRGQTWDNTIVVVDEAQNMNFHEINTIMTRIGHNSKVIIAGDSKQTDLFKSNKDSSYMTELERVLRDNKFFDTIAFNKHDIVRSDFVKSWIECTED
jgi:phosphate starvation-inducible PhoH-like protein